MGAARIDGWMGAIAAAALTWALPASSGSTLHVDAAAPCGGDGLSWQTALNDLQAALSYAGQPGAGVGEIRVADGTYHPTARTDPDEPRSVTFQLLEGVALRGGYAGFGAADPDERDVERHPTILSGRIGPSNASDCCWAHAEPGCSCTDCQEVVCGAYPPCCDPDGEGWTGLCQTMAWLACEDLCGKPLEFIVALHVVTAGNVGRTARLDGFTVADGDAVGRGYERSGGGLRNLGGSPTVVACTFADNGGADGGGVANISGGPLFVACRFLHNLAGRGGGMFSSDANPELIDCVFEANSSTDGGGGVHNLRSDAFIEGCTFSGNSGGGMHNDASHSAVSGCLFSGNYGSGMANSNGSRPTLGGCSFIGNEATRGGGIANDHSDPELSGCFFEANSVWQQGGAMYSEGSNPTVTCCEFIGNLAVESGGAVYHVLGRPTFTECTFEGNVVGDLEGHPSGYSIGGAMLLGGEAGAVTGCVFRGNAASHGGGALYMASDGTLVRNCRFEANRSVWSGGGAVRASSGAGQVFDSCTFAENQARWGAGIAVAYGETILTGCVIADNRDGWFGGGGVGVAYGGRALLTNCLLVGNSSAAYGGGLAVWADFDEESRAEAVNCTFAWNTAHREAGGGVSVGPDGNGNGVAATLRLTNCVLWANVAGDGGESAQLFVDDSSPGFTASVDYTCLEGWTGDLGGTGNLGGDPRFLDADGPDDDPGTEDDDLRLADDSPCIDAGLSHAMPPDAADLDGDGNTLELTPLDLGGNPRFMDAGRPGGPGCAVGAIVDIGAFEHQGGTAGNVVLGDLDGDLTVGLKDLAALAASWGPCSGCCTADLDLDGQVGMSDLLALLLSWQ